MGLYDETVAFWSKEDAFFDAVDAVGFGLTNPDIVADEISVSLEEKGNYIEAQAEYVGDVVKTAAMSGTMYLVKGVAVIGLIYIAFTSVTAYSNKKLERLAL